MWVLLLTVCKTKVGIMRGRIAALNCCKHIRMVDATKKGLTQRQVIDSLGEQSDIKPKLNLL